MEGKQLWQAEGLGMDRGTLETVLHVFESEGVQGAESQRALVSYIGKLSDDSLRDMCEIDKETALQILADCYGVGGAFEIAIRILGYVLPKTAERTDWISPSTYAEVVRKYEERTKKLNEEIDSLQRDYNIKNYEKEEADQKIKELQNTLAYYKADLYDFYAREGRVPKYDNCERG